MKHLKILLLLLLIIVYSVGCTNSANDSSEMIVSPNNYQIPIKGTWEITKVLEENPSKTTGTERELLGKILQFSQNHLIINDYYLENPEYKIKRVNGEKYLLYNYRSIFSDISLADKKVDVITITENNNHFGEIIKLNDEELVVDVFNKKLFLVKVSNNVKENAIQNHSEKNDKKIISSQEDEDSLLRSGVLIGLKSPIEEGNQLSRYQYRALWIAVRNKVLHPIVEMESIIVPRKSGFWNIKSLEVASDERTEDLIYASKILSPDNMNISRSDIKLSMWKEKKGILRRHINYISNDYMATEILGEGTFENSYYSWKENRLQILPIDVLPNTKGIKISDLSGQASLNAMLEGRLKTMESMNITNNNLLSVEELEENFGLERRMGHWFYIGRMSYERDGEVHFTDYNINAIPSPKLVVYDDLSISWTVIKDTVPEAIDAFTSPNKDLAIIFTRKNLLIYGIQSRKLEKSPLQKIELKDGEKVIMVEWATGRYVDKWENTFYQELESKAKP